MGGFTLPPGWSTAPPSGSGGGFSLPRGWSTTPPQQQAGGSWLDSILSALSGGGIGAAKGAGSTAFGLGSIVNSLSRSMNPSAIMGYTDPSQSGIGDMINPGSFDQKPEELVPQGTAQKVGFGGEQLAEFLLPGGMASKATKLLPFAERAAVQGLAGGGVGAAQSGGDPMETLKAALGGIAGEGLATGAAKALRPFLGSVDNAATEAAARQGVILPASAASKSKVVPLLESVASKGIGGGGVATRLEEAQSQLVRAADDAIKDASNLGSPSDVGQAVASGMAKYKATFLKTKGALYEAAALPEAGVKVDAAETRALLQRIIADKTQAASVLGKSADLPFFKTLSKRLEKPIEANVLLNARKELSKRASNFNDPLATGNKGTLKSVISAMDGELDAAIGKARPDIAAKLAEADAFYKDGISKINSTFGRSINKLAQTGQYDKISQAITNPRMSVEDITGIMKVAGPEGADGMRATVLSDMFAASKNSTGDGFQPLALARQIGKWTPEKLQALLGPDQWDKLKDLALLTTTLQRGQKIAEGSQTAYLTKIGAIGGAAFTNPAMAFKLIAGDAAFSRFIASKYGQKWLTTGLSLGSKPAAALRVAPQYPGSGQPSTQ